MEKKHSRSLLEDCLTVGAGTLMNMLLGVVAMPVITRLVDPAAYGALSMLNVYSSMGLMLCCMGLDQTLMRHFYGAEIADQRQLVRTCCQVPLGAAAILGCALWALHLLGAAWLTMTEIALLSLHTSALIFNRFSHLVVRLQAHTKVHAAISILQKAAYIALSIALITWLEGDRFVLLAAASILSALLSAGAAIGCERSVWARPDRAFGRGINRRALLRYGFPIMLSSGVNVVFRALDKLFIDRLCGVWAVGVYAGAMNLVAVFSIIKAAFSTVWMPAAIAHYEENPTDRRFYQNANAVISLLMLCFGACVVLCRDLFVLLLGSAYQEAARILPFLMFEPILYTISETTATGMVLMKKSGNQLIVACAACAANFLGNCALTPMLGAQGAALATGISYVVFFALRTHLAGRAFDVPYRLGRFAAALASLFAYAAYAGFHAFSWRDLPLFAGVLAVTLWGYRDAASICLRAGMLVQGKKDTAREKGSGYEIHGRSG